MTRAADSLGEARIGYALGGGGARGLAHIGVLKVLEEHGLRPGIIAGTSMGSVIGALYASGLGAGDIERALRLNVGRLARLTDVRPSASGLVQGKHIAEWLKSLVGDLTFPDLKIPFACVATDILNGQEVVLRSGPVITAVRASISIPGIFTPVSVRGRYLVDGGLVNVVPVSTCREVGAEYVVAVNVMPDPAQTALSTEEYPDGAAAKGGRGVRSRPRKAAAPNVVKVLVQSVSITGYRVAKDNLRAADLAISVETGDIGFFQFDREAEAVEAGEQAARRALKKAGL